MTPDFDPPEHLSDASKALWLDLVPRRARSAGRRVMLEQALTALDRANQASEQLAAGSLTTTTIKTGAVHVNPLVKVEREGRQLFARLWGMLGFGWDNQLDGSDFDRALARMAAEAVQPDADEDDDE